MGMTSLGPPRVVMDCREWVCSRGGQGPAGWGRDAHARCVSEEILGGGVPVCVEGGGP